ncbi:MAG: transketolase family protein [Spirochaetaceae bacterium]|jgi:transketolase|nr:transketolase family protein [Spirochaetaceae bacterium]
MSTLHGLDLRERQIETLIRLTEEGANLMYLVSDSVSTSKIKPFKARFPDRVVNVGIAEQNLIGIAAGMANGGYIPVTGNAAPFLISRSAEQLKVDVSYANINVKVNGLHAGFSYGADGITHHEVNDISVIRGFPSFEIYVPCTPEECNLITEYAVRRNGPVYISLNTGVFPEILPPGHRFVPGKPVQFSGGTDVTIITMGSAIHDALEAAAALNHFCSMDIFALSSVRPLDAAPLLASIKKTGKVITLEQHSTHGGCGSLMAEAIADNGLGAALIRLGIPEGVFTKNAAAAANKKAFGLDAEGVTGAVRRILG